MNTWDNKAIADAILSGLMPNATIHAHPQFNVEIADWAKSVAWLFEKFAADHYAMAAQQRSLMACGMGKGEWHSPRPTSAKDTK